MNLSHRFDGPEDAPVLVLSNSLGTTLDLWELQVHGLARGHRVLRYDHRGHGGSPVPPGPYTIAELAGDLLELLDRLEVERVSFCGLSLGGVVGMWLGANAPERIDRLVVACSSARFGTRDAWIERAAGVRADGTESIADAVVARWFTPEFAVQQPQVVGRFREMVAGTPDEGYAACCDALRDWDFRDELGRVAPSTLLIVGELDPVVSAVDTEVLFERIPDARVRVIEGVAHLANVPQPEEFKQAVLSHLEAS
ncbi:MAG TPA: 3-oxoadipate enol-lactonase [Gaiellaceae bacterium]|nr:3-oxoadipate enol-lactonase [Gaiellaceae bacterium]